MNKLLTVIAATLLAVTAIASGAEAGFNVRIKAPADFSEVHKAGCGGGGGASRVYRRARYQSVRRSKPRAEVASRTNSKPAVVAKAETEAPAAVPIEETADVAQIENSSITTEEKVAEVKKPKTEKKVAEKPAKKAEQKVATAGDLGCKTFFASVGMTLSVPCDQK